MFVFLCMCKGDRQTQRLTEISGNVRYGEYDVTGYTVCDTKGELDFFHPPLILSGGVSDYYV